MSIKIGDPVDTVPAPAPRERASRYSGVYKAITDNRGRFVPVSVSNSKEAARLRTAAMVRLPGQVSTRIRGNIVYIKYTPTAGE